MTFSYKFIIKIVFKFLYDLLSQEVQRNYMSKVIEALQGSHNAVLESPTGTGKTLCLLCASLAWLLSKKAQVQACNENNCLNNMEEQVFDELNAASGTSGVACSVPKIIYASITHSQLTQVMREMKRTTYSYMKTAIIGSRDQLCIHPDVINKSGTANKIQMCRAKVLSNACSFFAGVEQKKEHPDFRETSILDIEDLVRAGNKNKCCPYFMSKHQVERADIVFMPYNYLLDPKARKANNIELHNSIIILDEAHNVGKMCEESASIQLKSSDLALCIQEVTDIMADDFGGADSEGTNFSLEELATFKELLLRLETNIDNLVVSYTEGSTYPG